MRPSAPLAVLATTVLLVAVPARAKDCNIKIGPNDRVSRGEPLVIRSGETVENAVSLHGDLTVERGAVVEKAVAVGGSVTLQGGSRVKQDAVAIGGDLVVEADARVGNDAVSLGGQVREGKGSRIEGSVVGLAFQGGKSSLARRVLKELDSLEACNVSIAPGSNGLEIGTR